METGTWVSSESRNRPGVGGTERREQKVALVLPGTAPAEGRKEKGKERRHAQDVKMAGKHEDVDSGVLQFLRGSHDVASRFRETEQENLVWCTECQGQAG